jgi:non-lysosomal glucosylceramidase
MIEKDKISRRKFLVESSAVVGATAITGAAGAEQNEQPVRGTPPRFTSPAGSIIPFSERELMAIGNVRSFTGAQLGEIAFPLGGIGTGTVSLGGRGDLRDWEIFNRPNKGKALPFTFVALWARQAGTSDTPIVKVVEAPLQPPFRGSDGFPRSRAQGLPRMESARFTGAYPFAEIAFEDQRLPLAITLEAFNPFVPLSTEDSALPVAIFRYRLTNRTKSHVDAALAFSILNAIGYDGRSVLEDDRFEGFGRNLTRLRREGAVTGLELTSDKYEADNIRCGSMALVTTHPDISARTVWEGGEWWDSFQKWFDEYAATGTLKDSHESEPTPDGVSSYATLAPRVTLTPGSTVDIRFVLAWFFPLRENYWNKEAEVKGRKLRNDYGTRFRSAWEVATQTVGQLDRLERDTRAFQEALMATRIPSAALDAVSSQMSIIRTNTCLLLEGRQFFAFEGNNDDSGCCPMNCTHVWNYEQALAHLFPDLERSMRVTDFTINLNDDGAMAFRTLVPLGRARWKFKPAADGQMGCILKLYREWQLSGDDRFLRELWPSAKRALEYAWKNWDADRDGVMEGEQHNTYDIEFYGPNTMMGTLYLGALLAGERMARAAGDNSAAETYRQVFESGRVKLDQQLWANGFYIQRVPDPKTIHMEQVEHRETWYASAITESGIKYQYGDGCLSDQLLGQWFAEVVGLGHLLPDDHLHEALHSIYKHNFKHNFFDHPNTQRIYALNDEKGLLLCSWPNGNRPALPFVYSDEVWTGIEYQVAAHLIYEGMVSEGLAITKAVRDRYDGQRRNPWNEVECGNHYARALSSWSLLTALSGYHYSAPLATLSFAPRVNAADFRCFFTTGSGWGSYRQTLARPAATAGVELTRGTLKLAELGIEIESGPPLQATATVNARAVPAVAQDSGSVRFDPPVTLNAGETLAVTLRRT